MSYQASDWAMAQPTGNAAAKLVLLILAHHRNHKTGQCYPSIATIARESGLSDRGVRNAIARLVKLKLVELRGSRTRRHYHLNVAAPAPGADVPRETAASGAATGAVVPASGAAVPARDAARSGTPCRRTGKEPESNREGENPRATDNAFSPKTKTLPAAHAHRDATATRLPTDWQPSPAWIAFAQREHPSVDWQREARGFRDYWLAKPGGASADWEASWRRWLGQAERFTTKPKSGATPPPFVSRPLGEPWQRRVQSYQKQRFWLSDWGQPPGSPSGCRVPHDVLREFGYLVHEREKLVPAAADPPVESATDRPGGP